MAQDLLVLGILLRGKMHGYRLNDYVAHTMRLHTDLKKSTGYHVLEKLEREGYIQHEVEREGKRPERRVYQITDKGKAFFFHLLRTHLGDFTRTYFTDDVATAFMDQLPTAEVRQLLAEKRKKIQVLLKQFQELPGHGGNWRHAVSHNIAHLEADLAWLNGILSELDGEHNQMPILEHSAGEKEIAS